MKTISFEVLFYLNTLIQSATWTEVYNDTSWQNGWTLFYYAWWFAWAPFVSLFIARFSYGRSIKEFIIGVLFVPSAIVFIWMGVFGNAAIYQVINETSQISEMVSSNLPVALFTLFDVYPIAQFLSILSLILIVTFFVTSSDSGALVASMLSSKSQSNINDYKSAFSKPFTYKKNGKDISLSNWSIPSEILEDRDLFIEWFLKSYRVALDKKIGKKVEY